jgi:hypothetical protein
MKAFDGIGIKPNYKPIHSCVIYQRCFNYIGYPKSNVKMILIYE